MIASVNSRLSKRHGAGKEKGTFKWATVQTMGNFKVLENFLKIE